jgi:hypothetical protein
MALSRAGRAINDHRNRVEQWDDYLGWINLRVMELVDQDFEWQQAEKIARREWHDGLGDDVDLCDLDGEV